MREHRLKIAGVHFNAERPDARLTMPQLRQAYMMEISPVCISLLPAVVRIMGLELMNVTVGCRSIYFPRVDRFTFAVDKSRQ